MEVRGFGQSGFVHLHVIHNVVVVVMVAVAEEEEEEEEKEEEISEGE